MKILNDNWLIFDDETSLSKALAQEILNIAKKSIFEKDFFQYSFDWWTKCAQSI